MSVSKVFILMHSHLHVFSQPYNIIIINLNSHKNINYDQFVCSKIKQCNVYNFSTNQVVYFTSDASIIISNEWRRNKNLKSYVIWDNHGNSYNRSTITITPGLQDKHMTQLYRCQSCHHSCQALTLRSPARSHKVCQNPKSGAKRASTSEFPKTLAGQHSQAISCSPRAEVAN